MTNIKIAGSVRHSSVNGPGVRYVLFFQGCPHHCRECQNPETWDPQAGQEIAVSDIVEEIRNTRYLDGVTFSGGDPMMQAEGLIELSKAVKDLDLSIWCYTGWTFEEILSGVAGEKAKEALSYIDVLVDGPFHIEEKTDSAIYRGSSNQRLVDLSKSLLYQKVSTVNI